MTSTETTDVRAIQFNGLDDYLRIVGWMKDCGDTYALADEIRYTTPIMLLQTPEGTVAASPGDWIVRGTDGGFSVGTHDKAKTPVIGTWRVQFNPGQDVDADSETFIDAETYERTEPDRHGHRWIEFHRSNRVVAEIREGNVVLIEEMDYTPEDRAARAAAMGRHPAGSELGDDGKPTPEAVLALPMEDNDSGADTVRGYLIALAAGVWDEGEGFSGKRPFGNSGWHYDLYKVLGVKGWIRCTVDSDGYVEDVDQAAGNELIRAALRHLAAKPAA